MATFRPLVLYSTNTSLAYNLNQHYYGGKHWVWCNPFFDERAARAAGFAAPPSSTPIDIYWAFAHSITRADYHSRPVSLNRSGLRTGAKAQLAAGAIGPVQFKEIVRNVRVAPLSEFVPLIYVIPFAKVARKAARVNPALTANPFSPEYQIASLDRGEFDIIRP